MTKWTDLILAVASIVAVLVVWDYLRRKTEIESKAIKGDLVAKAEKIIAQAALPIVYQAEKRGGTGDDKLMYAINGLIELLDLAHLPHPSQAYVQGEIEKSVAIMEQTQGIVDTFDCAKKAETTPIVTAKTVTPIEVKKVDDK